MSEMRDAAAGGGSISQPSDFPVRDDSPSSASPLVRLGGALGIAACVVGMLVFLAGCAGFGKALVLSIIPVALSAPGLVISVVGAVTQKKQIGEDTHVMHALFANCAGLIGGLLEMAVWRHWPLFGGH